MFSGGLKLSEDEDDFSFGPENTRTNLSNIFGVSVESSEKENTPSLHYVSTKQVKPIDTNASTDNTQDWKVEVAKVVTAYKLLNQENISQGKIGLAVLKNADDQFRIILYRSKNNVLSTSSLKDDTVIYRNNLYLQFKDDLQLFWSILFQPEDLEAILDIISGKINIQNQEQPAQDSKKLEIDSRPEEISSDERLKDTKASILSRMAKMGQPLPKLTTVTNTDLSDSSDMETKSKVFQKPVITSRKPKSQSLVPVATSNMQIISSTATLGGPVSYPAGNLVQDSQYTNILLAENRTQNSELRMNIAKLETKIEKVLDKIDNIGSRNSYDRRDKKEDEILELEEKILDLKKQNRALKLELREIEENTVVKTDIPEDFSEFNPLLHHYKINQDNSSASEPFTIYKKLITHLSDEIDGLNESMKQLKECNQDTHSQLQKANLELEKTTKLLDEQRSKYESDIEAVKQELTAVKRDNEELSKLVDAKPSAEGLVKEIMNNLYQRLSQQFEAKDKFTAIEVAKICANAIKAETNNVIKRK